MCSCDMPKTCNVTFRTARKDHRCCECRRPIVKGERYEYTSGVWDEPASFKTCADCAATRRTWSAVAWAEDGDCGPCLGDLFQYLIDADALSMVGSYRHQEFRAALAQEQKP